MPLRLPQNFTTHKQFDTGASLLEMELLSEHAATLGHLGKLVEKAINALTVHDASNSSEYEHLLETAVDAVYAYFIQREAIGATGHEYPIKFYGIPNSVLARLGAQKPGESSHHIKQKI